MPTTTVLKERPVPSLEEAFAPKEAFYRATFRYATGDAPVEEMLEASSELAAFIDGMREQLRRARWERDLARADANECRRAFAEYVGEPECEDFEHVFDGGA